MKKLFKKISKLFEQKSELEQYILSKNPQSASDVDFWSRKYSERKGCSL
jgi:hypothetical protein